MTPISYGTVSNRVEQQHLERRLAMPRSVLTAAVLLVFGASGIGNTKGTKAVKSDVPLGADEVAIYKTVLQQYTARKGEDRLNVSVRTYPFDPNSHRSSVTAECLRGIELQNLATVAHTFHVLAPGGSDSEEDEAGRSGQAGTDCP